MVAGLTHSRQNQSETSPYTTTTFPGHNEMLKAKRSWADQRWAEAHWCCSRTRRPRSINNVSHDIFETYLHRNGQARMQENTILFENPGMLNTLSAPASNKSLF